MPDNTIFDDVFRTMLEKMPYLAVPLINEVFHTSYPEDVEIVQLRNEYMEENGKIITDSCLAIGGKRYHIECQSLDDTTMAIRMIEYDFAIALQYARKKGRRYQLEFPRSCVLYLRSNRNTPDFLEADVIFPDGKTHLYQIPTIKMKNYTSSILFEKNLLMLLPFYIMRYEKSAHDMSEKPELFQEMLNEYEEIRHRLAIESVTEKRSGMYSDLITLMIRISDYIFQNEEKIRKGIGETMGGQVLELASERAERLAREAAEKAAIEATREAEERMGILINKLILDGRSDEIQKVVTDPELRKRMYKEYGLK